MRDQVSLTFMIGYPVSTLGPVALEFEKRIAEAASYVCGGCNTQHTTGWWADGGETHAENFTGAVVQEETLTVEVSCEIAKSQRAWRHIKNAIIVHAKDLGIDTNWVHVQRTPFMGMHFSVKSANLSASEVRDVVSPGTRGAR